MQVNGLEVPKSAMSMSPKTRYLKKIVCQGQKCGFQMCVSLRPLLLETLDHFFQDMNCYLTGISACFFPLGARFICPLGCMS